MLRKKGFIFSLPVLFVVTVFLSARSSAHTEGEHAHDHAGQMPAAADVIVDLMSEPARLTAGSPATIRLFLKDDEGRPLQGLSVTHDRLLHAIIMSRDFSVFAHIHPEDFGPITPAMLKTAEFSVRYVFPKAGEYLLAVDSAVRDTPFSEQFTIEVAGKSGMGLMRKDLARKKVVEGYEVSLAASPEHIIAGKETVLIYEVRRDATPVTDLEPYLSAPMHLAIVRSDLTNFIHTHGEIPGAATEGHQMGGHMHMTVPGKFGPRIDVHVVFPARGVYQIFGEIKHHGKVIVTSFMVQVE